MTGLAFIDTETTGLDPVRCPVWEVAVIVDDEEHTWTVKLDDPLPLVLEHGSVPEGKGPYLTEWVVRRTGFFDRYDRRTAITPEASAQRFARLTKDRHLVGAIPSFDEERLRAMHRAGPVPWHYHLIDVEALAVGYLHGLYVDPVLDLPWKSDDLSRMIGVEPPGENERHTALGDARWAKRIYDTVTSPRTDP